MASSNGLEKRLRGRERQQTEIGSDGATDRCTRNTAEFTAISSTVMYTLLSECLPSDAVYAIFEKIFQTDVGPSLTYIGRDVTFHATCELGVGLGTFWACFCVAACCCYTDRKRKLNREIM